MTSNGRLVTMLNTLTLSPVRIATASDSRLTFRMVATLRDKSRDFTQPPAAAPDHIITLDFRRSSRFDKIFINGASERLSNRLGSPVCVIPSSLNDRTYLN